MSPSPETPGAASWYEVDGRDVVVAVSPDWDRFALQNNGTAACGVQVLGRSLFAFILGDSTRMLIEAALQACRLTGHARSVNYRCDGPDIRRALRMTLQPKAGGLVRIEHDLLEAVPRTTPQAVRPTAAPRAWQRCSQCQRVHHAALAPAWVELDSLPSPPRGAPRPVQEVVCPSCAQAHQVAIQGAHPFGHLQPAGLAGG